VSDEVQHSRWIPVETRRILVEQAGGKCASPGCATRLTEFHHIEEWAVYHAHDPEHMICLCPTCHSQVERGDLQITDEELYAWKQIDRSKSSSYIGHIYVEPGPVPELLTGTLRLRGSEGVTVIDLVDQHRLSIVVRDREIVLVNLQVTTHGGERLLDIVDGHVRSRSERVEFSQRTGRVRIPAGIDSDLIPQWLRELLLRRDPSFGVTNELPLLDLKVEGPGIVRVQGIWVDDAQGGVVITKDKLILVGPESEVGFSLESSGAGAVVNTVGSFNEFVRAANVRRGTQNRWTAGSGTTASTAARASGRTVSSMAVYTLNCADCAYEFTSRWRVGGGCPACLSWRAHLTG
jgi:Zn finger protein HypA/HybF involved in hydrogenase expression